MILPTIPILIRHMAQGTEPGAHGRSPVDGSRRVPAALHIRAGPVRVAHCGPGSHVHAAFTGPAASDRRTGLLPDITSVFHNPPQIPELRQAYRVAVGGTPSVYDPDTLH